MKTITTFPYDLAKRRVERGIKWLRANAPGYWRRNLFEIRGDKAVFRAKDAYGNECVLALAFEHQPEMANEFGYVTFGSVSNAFELSYNQCVQLGFATNMKSNAVEQAVDKAWERILRDFIGDGIPRKHRALKLNKRALARTRPRTRRGLFMPKQRRRAFAGEIFLT